MKHTKLCLVGLLLLSACSSQPRTASISAENYYTASNSCTALGFSPGSASYDNCIENNRIRQDVIARKVMVGSKNQPDGVMAQTYGKRMGISINCTSYSMPMAGSPTLCD